jgi:hypothetical protein
VLEDGLEDVDGLEDGLGDHSGRGRRSRMGLARTAATADGTRGRRSRGRRSRTKLSRTELAQTALSRMEGLGALAEGIGGVDRRRPDAIGKGEEIRKDDGRPALS